MLSRAAILLALAALPGVAADWNPKLAAEYLDSRQKEWFAWPTAKAPGGVSVSCHTGMTYLMARPLLRRKLGETAPTEYEQGLLSSIRARVDKRDVKDVFPSFSKEPTASQAMGVESILSALFLRDEKSRERLLALQKPSGAWPWFSLNLDPWEMPESEFFGAVLAAMAIGTPGNPELSAYLQRESSKQPLHNRIMLLWISPSKPIIDEALKAQQPDGGWTLASLGPWKSQENAPPAPAGSHAYATAFAALSLQKGGLAGSNKAVARALDWLKSHQDRESGSWEAMSMNKSYADGSMQIRFMRDAATAYASMALLMAEPPARPH